jgi:hypothetical protein
MFHESYAQSTPLSRFMPSPPASTSSSSLSTTSSPAAATLAANDASPPDSAADTADVPVILYIILDRRYVVDPIVELLGDAFV